MSAYTDAAGLYDPKDLGTIIAICANDGFVYSTPTCFLCAYPVFRQNLNNHIETESKLELDNADTWFVYIASGCLKEAFEHIQRKKYVAFERFDGKLRVLDFDRFRRLIWVDSVKM
jgi:hypothetical protein